MAKKLQLNLTQDTKMLLKRHIKFMIWQEPFNKPMDNGKTYLPSKYEEQPSICFATWQLARKTCCVRFPFERQCRSTCSINRSKYCHRLFCRNQQRRQRPPRSCLVSLYKQPVAQTKANALLVIYIAIQYQMM